MGHKTPYTQTISYKLFPAKEVLGSSASRQNVQMVEVFLNENYLHLGGCLEKILIMD